MENNTTMETISGLDLARSFLNENNRKFEAKKDFLRADFTDTISGEGDAEPTTINVKLHIHTREKGVAVYCTYDLPGLFKTAGLEVTANASPKSKVYRGEYYAYLPADKVINGLAIILGIELPEAPETPEEPKNEEPTVEEPKEPEAPKEEPKEGKPKRQRRSKGGRSGKSNKEAPQK